MDYPEKYLDVFIDAGASVLTIHAEIDADVAAMLEHIRSRGVKSGLSVKPGTPAEAIRRLLPHADMVLVMTVEPGFGGQKFMADMMPKVKQLREWMDDINPACLIEVDGGVDSRTHSLCKENGADVLVAGSAYFGAEDKSAFVRLVQS